MLTTSSDKKVVICITNAFTKYATVMALPNKEAERVPKAILLIGSANLAHWHRFTWMEERNLATNFQ
jgi:hypothetical protein